MDSTKTAISFLLVVGIIATLIFYFVPDEDDETDSSQTTQQKTESENTQTAPATTPRPQLSQEQLSAGRELAQTYCQSCHTYPEPGLLPRHIWAEQALPHMGPQLGIFQHNGERYPVERTPNLPDNYYPQKKQLSNEDWQKIIDYYLAEAPDKLNREEGVTPITTDSLFLRARTPSFRVQTPPMVSAVRFDPGNKLIYLSDASNSMFYMFDQNLAFKDRYQLTSAISDIRFAGDPNKRGRRELLTTYIGDVNPSDALSGFVQMVWYEPDTEQGSPGAVFIDSLARPVESQFADFNQDGREDLLVNEFAHRTGKLFWLDNVRQEGIPKMNILSHNSGCVESKILDYTGNGLADIFALCTQVDQSLYLFRNQGDGTFEQEELLQFKITAGSSSFALHDFNNDGHLDIIYTSGDNADYSITHKPYHGVYIYLNDGDDNFTKEWFYPINGAYDAEVRDFDKDGHLDIAVISFFANYRDLPEESFVYFKGNGDLDFTPYSHPAATTGRWIAMDIADWTGNGYPDIVLANFSRGPTQVFDEMQNRWLQGPHFLLLENMAGSQ